jgi:alginate O-acetyltransferase complex protein AlgI
MNFVSKEFAVLFCSLLLLLSMLRSDTARRLLLLAVSCVFYGWADWRFLGLLATITVVDYRIAKALAGMESQLWRKRLLLISVATNLGFLFAFKYFGFFVKTLSRLGLPVGTVEIALPIGISFYTFETLSYVIDVYRRTTLPARSLLDYAVFITFFPRLVAGPIMRAQQFLPQLQRGIVLTRENAVAGLQLIAVGALKKLVIADSAAIFVDGVYRGPEYLSPITVWAAVFTYSIQIFCDFSGYTDMATGMARILGITLPPNFRLPYTAQSLTEFWQRWHISLSTWLRDYLYIPLGGSRETAARTYRNLMLTMLLGGLWHGANWTFVIWGGLHGFLLAIERKFIGGRPEPAPWTSVAAWFRATACFVVVSLTWTFFRSPGLRVTVAVWKKLLLVDSVGTFWVFWPAPLLAAAVFVGGLLMRRFSVTVRHLSAQDPLLPVFLVFALLCILLFHPLGASPFIYFRF